LGDSADQQGSRRRVAIIGSGPGGLVAARYLKQHGFQPVVFEQDHEIGGQWNAHSPHSGIWPSMVTNTSRLLTCFSDLAPEPGTPIFPSNVEILAYLKRYARTFDILSQVRFNTRVELVERDPDGGGWLIRSDDTEKRSEIFPYVVVASGRFNKPLVPSLPGLESFSGSRGVLHSFEYKDPDSFRGKRVLVVGCAISALEIASDLAMVGALRTVSTFRRQRYVVQKLVAGVPSDALAFTRFAALNAEVTPKEVLGKKMQDYILRVFGSPERFGALSPAGDFVTVGRAFSQHFLLLVAEGRIVVRPSGFQVKRWRNSKLWPPLARTGSLQNLWTGLLSCAEQHGRRSAQKDLPARRRSLKMTLENPILFRLCFLCYLLFKFSSAPSVASTRSVAVSPKTLKFRFIFGKKAKGTDTGTDNFFPAKSGTCL